MMKPPSPPAGSTEYLAQLADYYRDLVEYHQKAAIVAAQQLGHVEALLGTEPVLPQAVETQSWLVDEAKNHRPIPEITSNQVNETPDDGDDDDTDDDDIEEEEETDDEIDDDTDDDDIEEEEETDDEIDDDTNDDDTDEIDALEIDAEDEPPHVSLDKIKELLEAERGKMLHIDYIVHYFYGPNSNKQQMKPLIEKQLQEGASFRMWAYVPDSPECWTLTLLDFPDLASKHHDNPLFPEMKTDTLPTKKVADLLSMSNEQIYKLKNLYPEQFLKRVDYFQNSKGHYLWAESGQKKLAYLNEQLESQNKKDTSTKSHSEILMLPQYQGLSKIQAIKKMLQSHQGKALNIAEIVKELYGELTQEQWKLVRPDVTTNLSSGKQKGLWKKVPGKLGFYRA